MRITLISIGFRSPAGCVEEAWYKWK